MDELQEAINQILAGNNKLTSVVKDKELRRAIVYHLHTAENMTLREISRRLQVDEKTVHKYIREYIAKIKEFNTDELNKIALEKCNRRIKEIREIIEELRSAGRYNVLAKFYNLLRREEELQMNLQGLLNGSMEGGVGGRNVNIVIMSNIRRGQNEIKNVTPKKVIIERNNNFLVGGKGEEGNKN